MQSSFLTSEIEFIRGRFFHIISKLYPHFNNPLYTVFIRNIVYVQNCIAECKKCSSILKKSPLPVVG